MNPLISVALSGNLLESDWVSCGWPESEARSDCQMSFSVLSLPCLSPSLLMQSRGPWSKSRELDSRTVVQPCIWFKEEQASSPWAKQHRAIMEKPHTGLEECPRILLSCFRARMSHAEVINDVRSAYLPLSSWVVNQIPAVRRRHLI